MSPSSMRSGLSGSGFPRVSGDEPAKAQSTRVRFTFSPRERG